MHDFGKELAQFYYSGCCAVQSTDWRTPFLTQRGSRSCPLHSEREFDNLNYAPLQSARICNAEALTWISSGRLAATGITFIQALRPGAVTSC